MDNLFAIPDPQILQMGLAELKAQAKNTDTHQETNSVDETTDDDLLSTLNGKALKTAIDSVKTVGKIQWKGGKESDGIMEIPYPDDPDEIWVSFSIFDPDTDYSDNYEKYCKGILPTDMNVRQIRTMLTYLVRGEKYCDGFINKYLENHYLLKLLLRLDDLLIDYYQRHQLPVELRYKNPVFWYEMDQNGIPALVKGNGERFTTDRSNEMYERSCQSQQGWQRAILYMDMIHEWDVTLLPKVQIDVVVGTIPVESVIETAKQALYTGHIGDGKIFVYDVAKVVKVRTSEEDFDALRDVE